MKAVCLCVTGAAALVGMSSSSFAAYTLTNIADSTSFSSVGSAVINNSGHIAFTGTKSDISGGAYFRYDRATGQSDFVYNQPRVLTPQLGDNGELAWQYNFGSNHTYIRKGSPGNVTLIEEVFSGGHADSPVINGSGDVVYTKASNAVVGRYSINLREGSTTTVVTDTGTGAGADDGTFFSFKPDVNDKDQVAYMGGRDASAGGGQALWLWNKAGNTTVELANSVDGHTFSFGPSINESSQVAFVSNGAVYVSDGTGAAPALYTRATDANGTSISFVTINDSGQVAYGVNGISPGFSSAIFVSGGTGTPTRVVGLGDAFDGSTIRFLNYSRGGFNNAGDVAFAATLWDGRSVIGLASVPEPSGLAILALGAGILCRRRQR